MWRQTRKCGRFRDGYGISDRLIRVCSRLLPAAGCLGSGGLYDHLNAGRGYVQKGHAWGDKSPILVRLARCTPGTSIKFFSSRTKTGGGNCRPPFRRRLKLNQKLSATPVERPVPSVVLLPSSYSAQSTSRDHVTPGPSVRAMVNLAALVALLISSSTLR